MSQYKRKVSLPSPKKKKRNSRLRALHLAFADAVLGTGLIAGLVYLDDHTIIKGWWFAVLGLLFLAGILYQWRG
jgi:hypothetical protein